MHHRRAILIALLSAATLGPSSLAATSTWVNPGSGAWSVGTNWDTDPVIPNSIDDTAIFSSTLQSQSAPVITIDQDVTVGTLSVDSASGFLFSASNGSLTFAASAGPASLTINDTNGTHSDTVAAPVSLASDLSMTNNIPITPGQLSGNLSISGNLSGNGALALNGSGLTLLSGNNSAWTGTLAVNKGVLLAASATALGAGGGVTVSRGAALSIGAAIPSSTTITLAGGALTPGYGYSAKPPFSTDGPVLLTADSTFESAAAFGLGTAGRLTINGPVEGAANLSIPSGNFIFTAANTLSGNVSISGANSTFASTASALSVPHFTLSGGVLGLSTPAGTNPALNSVQAHSILLTGGSLALNADLAPAQFLDPGSTSGAIAINVSNFTAGGLNKINMNAFPGGSSLRLGCTGSTPSSIAPNVGLIPDFTTHTLRFGIANPAGSTLAVRPVISDINGTPTNVDIGPGNSTEFDAANTYSGITTVNGVLTIMNAAGLGAGSGTDADGTIINPGGALYAATGTILANEKITLNGGHLEVSSNAEVHVTAPSYISGTFNGPITGPGDLTAEIGSLTLNGNNTFSGNLTLSNQAVLNANSPSTLGDDVGSTSVYPGSTLNLNAPCNETVNLRGGTAYVYAATTGPITIDANIYTQAPGQLFVESDTSSPITLNGGNLTIDHTCSSPITINGGNNPVFNAVPSGPITVNAGNVTFGSINPTGLTTVHGGTVTFTTPGNYPIRIAGGTVNLAYSSYAASYAGNMTIGGGNSTLIGQATLDQNITLAGNATLASSGYLYVDHDIIGAGDLFIRSTYSNPSVFFSAQPDFTGTFHAVNSDITFYGACTFNTAFSFEGSSVTFDQSCTFNQPLTATAGSVDFYSNQQQFLAPFNILGGNVYFGPSNFAGGLRVSGGLASLSAVNDPANQWALSGGTIAVYKSNTVASLTLTGGSLQITNGATLTISSPTLTVSGGTVSGPIDGPTSLVKTADSTMTFLTPLPASITSINIQQGTLALSGTAKVNAFAIAGSTNNWSGTLDLGNGELILEAGADKSSALSDLRNQVLTHAITSSTLPPNMAIAVIDNAITNFSTLGNLPVDQNSLLLTPLLLGDANADNTVNTADLQIVLNHFGQPSTDWTAGNFTGDPTIDLTDLSYVLNNMNLTYNPATGAISSASSTPVPEPASLALLALAATPLLLRRRTRG